MDISLIVAGILTTGTGLFRGGWSGGGLHWAALGSPQ